MRTIYAGGFLGLLWTGFYNVLPHLNTPASIVVAFALAGFLTLAISAVFMGRK